MPLADLVACPACTRHVRVDEPSCPFCGHGTNESLRQLPRSRTADLTLGRVALYALGAGTMTLAAACSSSSMVVAFYGVAPDAAFGEPDAGGDAKTPPLGDDATGDDADADDDAVTDASVDGDVHDEP